jgi:hypothetical protein
MGLPAGRLPEEEDSLRVPDPRISEALRFNSKKGEMV